MSNRAFTVRDLSERYCVGEHTVLCWIRRGELRAVDVSRNRGGKPRWRISAEGLAAFELARTTCPPPASTRRTRAASKTIKFY